MQRLFFSLGVERRYRNYQEKEFNTLSNPGAFRIDLEEAKLGGVSDPRKSALIKMFNLVNIGERAGSGIPNIYSVWKKQGWSVPVISESFEPERITVLLPLAKTGDKKVAIKTANHKQAIVQYLTDNAFAKSAELAELIGVKASRIKVILTEMIADGIIESEGGNRNKIYKLKR